MRVFIETENRHFWVRTPKLMILMVKMKILVQWPLPRIKEEGRTL